MPEAILFLHGIPTRGCLWNGIVGRLSSRFLCITVDLPPEGFRNLAALAARLENIRTEHGIERWHVVAHDGGCAVAVHYAHQFPYSVGCVALLSPSMFPELKPFYLFELLRKPVLGELLAPAVNLLFWSVVMRLAVEGCRDEVKHFRAPFRGLRGSWRLMSLLRWGNPTDVLASIPTLLPAISAPTLVFHGLKDRAVPAAFARRACELIPHSDLILLNCGHFLPLSEPEAIAEGLLRLFGSQERWVHERALAATAAGMPR
jgi:pimeloyl-ACP methyl ester carboxylesterase